LNFEGHLTHFVDKEDAEMVNSWTSKMQTSIKKVRELLNPDGLDFTANKDLERILQQLYLLNPRKAVLVVVGRLAYKISFTHDLIRSGQFPAELGRQTTSNTANIMFDSVDADAYLPVPRLQFYEALFATELESAPELREFWFSFQANR